MLLFHVPHTIVVGCRIMLIFLRLLSIGILKFFFEYLPYDKMCAHPLVLRILVNGRTRILIFLALL